LVTCHRFRRRLRFCLESLARQELPPGTLEVVVADPESPDGLAEYLREFSATAPNVRVVRLPLHARYRRNRGYCIDRAFDASSGDVVIGIDGDIVFPPRLVGHLANSVKASPDKVFGVRRAFLDRPTTEEILAGRIDPVRDFDRLSLSEGDGQDKSFVGVLGYCQAVERSAFAKARYPREFDKINQSDIVFVERLAREAGVTPVFLQDAQVLHLWHPRNWAGTNEDL
jgi:glycosyltransferase involved in cell wall biosynthesis